MSQHKIYKAIKKPASILINLFLILVLILPAFEIKPGIPKFSPEDLILPFCILLLLFVPEKKKFLVDYKIILFPIIFYMFWILISIVINNRIEIIRDHFEWIKIVKLLIFVIFFAIFIDKYSLNRTIKITFGILLAFNLAHYINLFHINEIIEPYYVSSMEHLDYFGKDTIGRDATKRMIGTLGNPNNNSILFMFFLIYFFSNGKKDRIWFYLATFGMLACQSRTGFISWIIIMALAYYITRTSLKTILIQIFIFGLEYIALLLLGNVYIGTLGSTAVMKTNSVMGRLEIWTHLGKMLLQRPIFGYAPYKEYFEANQLYSESEYMQSAWRYGFIGLFAYLWFLIVLTVQGWRNRITPQGLQLFLFVICFLVTSITNTPFSSPKLAFLLALSIGIFINHKLNNNVQEKVIVD